MNEVPVSPTAGAGCSLDPGAHIPPRAYADAEARYPEVRDGWTDALQSTAATPASGYWTNIETKTGGTFKIKNLTYSLTPPAAGICSYSGGEAMRGSLGRRSAKAP